MSALLARPVSIKNRRVALLSAASAVAMVVGAAAPQQARAGDWYWVGNFILSSDDQSGAQSRFELGGRYEDVFRMADGRQLFLRSQIAWMRSHTSTPQVHSGFAALAGSRFAVAGTSAGPDALALATSLDLPLSKAMAIGARVDGEWTHNSRGVSGQASISLRW